MQTRLASTRAPDLLFEDVCQSRLEDLGDLLHHPEDIDPSTPLHRITVFLTYACNLDCPYCKTIARSAEELAEKPQKKSVFDLAAFEALLKTHESAPVRHLHFTGGEATLVRQMPQMVACARKAGVEAVSVTSNGTQALSVYRDLIAAGLDEIRISLDAADAVTGEALTHRPLAWQQTVETIKALAGLRDGSKNFHLVVNTVVSRANRERLPEIVAFLLSLRPDDIKLITNVDQRDELSQWPGAPGVCRQITAMLSNYPDEAFPLLRRKLRTVFAVDAIGLESIKADDWRCYIPLTERTVDGKFYYPCSVYLREGGAPLGPLSDSADTQREKSAQFVMRGDCLSDPICRRYCLNCTRNYNIVANERRA
jgi:molybdenum cofactor biosynthesis enzyme MoaA